MEFDKEEIIIKRENNFFIASIETLGISSKGSSRNSSISNLKKKYIDYKDFIEKNDIKSIRKEPDESDRKNNLEFFHIIKRAFIKFLSNLFFFIITLFIILTFIKSEFLKINHAKFERGGDMFEKIVSELDKASNPKNDLDPALQEKILKDLRTVLSRAKPFIKEIKILFED